MTKKEHNGYTNHETWIVRIWMDNEKGSQDKWLEEAKKAHGRASGKHKVFSKREEASFILSDTIKNWHEMAMPHIGNSVFGNLMTAAMSEVNWDELAKVLIDQLIEDKKIPA